LTHAHTRLFLYTFLHSHIIVRLRERRYNERDLNACIDNDKRVYLFTEMKLCSKIKIKRVLTSVATSKISHVLSLSHEPTNSLTRICFTRRNFSSKMKVKVVPKVDYFGWKKMPIQLFGIISHISSSHCNRKLHCIKNKIGHFFTRS
jgi:hypothetical protein